MITAYAMWRFGQSDWNTSFFYLSLSMSLMAIGMATVMPPTMAKAIGSLPPRLIGYGSGAVNFVLQLGGAFGTVFLVVMVDRNTAWHSAQLTHSGLTPGNPIAHEALRLYGQIVQHTGSTGIYIQAAAKHLLRSEEH